MHPLIPQTYHHLAFPNLCKSKSSDPVAQGRSPGVIPDATLPLASNSPSILLELLTTFPHLHLHLFSVPAPTASFPLLCSFSGFLLFFTCPLPLLPSPSLLLFLHVVIRMVLEANVTLSFPCSKLLTSPCMQFRIMLKKEHFEMERTCVQTLVLPFV